MYTQAYKENKMIPFGLDNDTSAKVKGDLLMTFKCKSQTAKLRMTPECYEDIPIQEEGFVNPETRIYQKHSAVTPNDHPCKRRLGANINQHSTCATPGRQDVLRGEG